PVAVREVAWTPGDHEGRAHDPRAADELRDDELDARGRAQLEPRGRTLRGEPAPRHDGVPLLAVVLMEAAHVPAVVELPDAPLAPVAGAPPVLVDGEVLLRPLAVDPADGALDLLGGVAPAELPAHDEPALEVRVRPLGAEEHHLSAQLAPAEGRRWAGRV